MKRVVRSTIAASVLLACASLTNASEPTRLPVAVVTLSLDDATQGQIRYGRWTVAAVGAGRGPFDFAHSPIEETVFQPCLRYRLQRAANCVRSHVDVQNARQARPPLVVVLLSDADTDEDRKPGQLQLSCVGAGDVATSPRQTIRIWPTAARLAGSRDLEIDREAVIACISAAAAEIDI